MTKRNYTDFALVLMIIGGKYRATVGSRKSATAQAFRAENVARTTRPPVTVPKFPGSD
jgi:hypothetical protein